MTALSTCSDDDAVQPVHKPAGLPGDTLQQTIIIYMAGENSLAEFVSIDSMEIAAAMPDMDENCRVVVFIDDGEVSGGRRNRRHGDEPVLAVVCVRRGMASRMRHGDGKRLWSANGKLSFCREQIIAQAFFENKVYSPHYIHTNFI